MKQSRRRFLTIAAAACLAGHRVEATQNRFRFIALGADAQITLPGDPETANRAMLACRREIKAMERSFSLWSPNSALVRLNRDGRIADADARFIELTGHARKISTMSDGGFDPTVQPLWTALATGGDPAAARALIGWRGLRMEGSEASFERPGMAATFNGIAQGYAADRVVAILKRHGYRDALVNIGEFHGIGSRADGAPWRIGVAHPVTGAMAAMLPVSNEAVATSEPRGTLVRGQPHIFDPLDRPGKRWLSVTVIDDTAWRADAISTALAAAPIHEAPALLRRSGIRRAVLISPDGAVMQWPENPNPATAGHRPRFSETGG